MTETILTKDQLFDINEFIYQNGHESLWRVGDKLEKVLGEIAICPEKDKKISKFLSKHGAKTVHTLNDRIFNLVKELITIESLVEEASCLEIT